MYLQLAESGTRLVNGQNRTLINATRSNIKHQTFAERGKKYNVSGYWRERNYVEPHKRKYLSDSPIENPYIFIPNFKQGGGVYVREDKFDSMPNDQWKIFMANLAPYQPEVNLGVSEHEFLANRADRKKRREGRQERRKTRADSKAEAREIKAEAKMTKADAKRIKAEGGGGGFDWQKAGDTVGGIVGKVFGKGDQGTDGTIAPTDETPFYKKPIVLGIGTLVFVGGVYMLTKKKK